jgi:DNA-binding NtrC family response regulator
MMSGVDERAVQLEVVTVPTDVVTTNALSVVVVEPALNQLLATVSTLSAAGFHVTAAEGFAQAKPLLSSGPAVLLTAARLGMYNGLHLVVRGKAIQPGMAALVTSPVADSILQSDAEALGATFVQTPIANRELIASILQTYFRSASDRRPVRPPFERRTHERRTSIRAVDPNVERRAQDRRRVLPWLVPPSSQTP